MNLKKKKGTPGLDRTRREPTLQAGVPRPECPLCTRHLMVCSSIGLLHQLSQGIEGLWIALAPYKGLPQSLMLAHGQSKSLSLLKRPDVAIMAPSLPRKIFEVQPDTRCADQSVDTGVNK